MAGKEKWPELLQSFPCLWNPKDPDFSNEAVKEACCEHLLEICNVQSSVPVDMETLKQWLSDNIVTPEFQGVTRLVQPLQQNQTLGESGVQQQNIMPTLSTLAEEFPCLWHPDHPHYGFGVVRNLSLQLLLVKYNDMFPEKLTLRQLKKTMRYRARTIYNNKTKNQAPTDQQRNIQNTKGSSQPPSDNLAFLEISSDSDEPLSSYKNEEPQNQETTETGITPTTEVTNPTTEITVPDTPDTITVPDTEITPATETAAPENDQNSLEEIERNKAKGQKSQSASEKGEKETQQQQPTLATLMEEFPCLWDPEHPHFRFGAVKTLSLQLLLAKYNDAFPEKLTMTQLRKKMRNLSKKNMISARKAVNCVTQNSKKQNRPKHQESNVEARTEDNSQPRPDRLALFEISSNSSDSDEPLSNYKHRLPRNQEITAPNTKITVPNTEIDVRNRRITVPNTKITVPNTGIIVPNTEIILPNTGIIVPNTGISVPNTGIPVPNTVITVPNTGITVPNTTITVPNIGIPVPNTGTTVPNTGITVPNTRITVPNTGITVPNTGIPVPNTGNTPNTGITVPKTGITVPNTTITVPNTRIPVPNTGNTPNTGITVPKTGITVPNTTITVPNTRIPVPNTGNTPNTGIIVPNTGITVPNTTITVPNTRITVPNTGNTPNTGITVPNNGITFPDTKVTIPNAVISYNWCRFCGELKNDCTKFFHKNRTYLSGKNDCALHVNDLWFYVGFEHKTLPNTICGDCDKILLDIFAFVKHVRDVQATFIILEKQRLKRKSDNVDAESKDGSGGKKFKITIDLNSDKLPSLYGDEEDCVEINCNDKTDSLREKETDEVAKENCEVIDLSDDDIDMKPENEVRPHLSNDTELPNEVSESSKGVSNDISSQSQCVYETNDNVINCTVETNSLSVTNTELANEEVKHDRKCVVPVNVISQLPCVNAVNGNRWVEVSPMKKNDRDVNNEESERSEIGDSDGTQSCVDENDDSLSATDIAVNEVNQPNISKIPVDIRSKNIVSYKINGEDFIGICTDNGSHSAIDTLANKIFGQTDLNSHSPLEDDANGAVSKYRHLLLDSLSLDKERNDVVSIGRKSQLSSCNDNDLDILNNDVESKCRLLLALHPLNTKSGKISEQNDNRVVSADVNSHLTPSNNEVDRNNDIESKYRHLLLDSLAAVIESEKVTEENHNCVVSVDVKPNLTPLNNEFNRYNDIESKYRHLLLNSLAVPTESAKVTEEINNLVVSVDVKPHLSPSNNKDDKNNDIGSKYRHLLLDSLASTESAKVTEKKDNSVISTNVKPHLSPSCNTGDIGNNDVESKYKRLLFDSLSVDAESAEENKQKNQRVVSDQTSPSNKDNGIGSHDNETDSNDTETYEKFIKGVLLQAINSAGIAIRNSVESVKSIKCVGTRTIVNVKTEMDENITDKEV